MVGGGAHLQLPEGAAGRRRRCRLLSGTGVVGSQDPMSRPLRSSMVWMAPDDTTQEFHKGSDLADPAEDGVEGGCDADAGDGGAGWSSEVSEFWDEEEQAWEPRPPPGFSVALYSMGHGSPHSKPAEAKRIALRADLTAQLKSIKWRFGETRGAWVKLLDRNFPQRLDLQPGDRLLAINQVTVLEMTREEIEDVWRKQQQASLDKPGGRMILDFTSAES